MEESERANPVIVIYKSYKIEAHETQPGLWRVRITRVDGAKIKTFPDGNEYSEVYPPNESLDAKGAIDFAREKINGGGMS
jgi:hypothetical protein